MTVFIDTSALIAVLDTDELNHERAASTWRQMIDGAEDMICTNYIIVETCAVAQRRLGIEAVRALEERAAPLLRIVWISEDEHNAAMKALLTANRRQLSLVDCTSFGVMRQLGIWQAFAFDEHFAEQGFECVP
jgi:uncharacterized protein